MLPSWLWIAFTVAASSAQTARNAMQRGLTETIGTQGATYVRFLFGLPFALIFLVAMRVASGAAIPAIGASAIGWAFAGATLQVAATALMLTAMRSKSFLVAIAYTKTEPILVAIFSVAILGEMPTAFVALAIVVATVGVLLMSWPKRTAETTGANWRPALIGLASGACFALSATGFRGCVLALSSPSFLMIATTTLVLGLLIQCALIVVWLGVRDRALLRAIAGQWRASMRAGFMGALASQCWFAAFALTSVASVRTLGLIEAPMAFVVTRRVFNQGMTRAEIVGTALIVVGVALLVHG